jgi:hypothetical protein
MPGYDEKFDARMPDDKFEPETDPKLLQQLRDKIVMAQPKDPVYLDKVEAVFIEPDVGFGSQTWWDNASIAQLLELVNKAVTQRLITKKSAKPILADLREGKRGRVPDISFGSIMHKE